MAFDPDRFVAECQAAAAESDPVQAVRDVVEATIRQGTAIDDTLGVELTGDPDTLFHSSGLTVQRIMWPGGSASAPHDHRMWAVVGVYAGCEVNTIFDRQGGSINPSEVIPVDAGGVLTLPVHAVHAVRNPDRRWTAGLHVYGGDIIDTERSAWLPDGTEAPQCEVAAQRRIMVGAMRAVAMEAGENISDERRFAALTALWREVERVGRNLTADEARAVVASEWGVAP
ncbi:MAG TPA: hypothetical protein VFZ64_06180 [Nocardioidaceae bacterium]